jgi:hypothetical protein
MFEFMSTPSSCSSSSCNLQEPQKLIKLAHSSEIYKANKQQHFYNLKKQYSSGTSASAGTGIELNEMLFFDNESHNTASTSKIGVVSIHCPHGMTRDIWNQGLKKYSDSKDAAAVDAAAASGGGGKKEMMGHKITLRSNEIK